jgi:hypothetical protein
MKKFREHIAELSVPQGATGKRTDVRVDYETIRQADGKLRKLPAGKSGSSGGGGQ